MRCSCKGREVPLVTGISHRAVRTPLVATLLEIEPEVICSICLDGLISEPQVPRPPCVCLANLIVVAAHGATATMQPHISSGKPQPPTASELCTIQCVSLSAPRLISFRWDAALLNSVHPEPLPSLSGALSSAPHASSSASPCSSSADGTAHSCLKGANEAVPSSCGAQQV